MHGDSPVSWLMFFTLVATVVIVGGAFVYFVRERTNRQIAASAIKGDGGSRHGAAPHGAGFELIGLAVIAIALMGLLAAGYHGKPREETAQAPSPVGGATTGMAQPVGAATGPQKYQPANPAPDTRAAPTGSDTGTGSSNGGTNTYSSPQAK